MAIRIAFFGSDPIALPMLDMLANSPGLVSLSGVWTQPDRRKGRGMKQVANPVKEWAVQRGLTVRQPSSIGAEDVAWLEKEGIELIIVMAYGHLLKRSLIELPRLGTVNLHGSILPKYRGASPVETAIAVGEQETGVSLMRIVPKMDAGPVMDIERVAISPADTGPALRAKLAAACVPLMQRALPILAAGNAQFIEQDHAQATYCRRLTKEDAVLDFEAPARVLADRVRAFTPWPGAICYHGETTLKIGAATAGVIDSADAYAPGEIIESGKGGILVSTANGSCLQLTQFQRPGGKMLPAIDFLRGYPLLPGELLQGGNLTDLLR